MVPYGALRPTPSLGTSQPYPGRCCPSHKGPRSPASPGEGEAEGEEGTGAGHPSPSPLTFMRWDEYRPKRFLEEASVPLRMSTMRRQCE